jgi:hypothetical protein
MARAEAAEAACAAVRVKAIELCGAGQICDDGLTRFVDADGLEPYDGG